MKGKRVLIVGGAGFIGSHLTDRLLAEGHYVRILDSLDSQVHGPGVSPPDYLSLHAEFLRGDVRDPQATDLALRGVDIVFHLAASVGVGQSMYEITRYSSNNALGTAVLLETLIKHPVERLIVASSMSIYGEGLYADSDGRIVGKVTRDLNLIRRHLWDPTGDDGLPLQPLPTDEAKPVEPKSVYALLKYHQECMCLCVGDAYNIPVVALRFFNAYGPRQALSNPYTGVIAIFASRLLNRRPPMIFEDGLQLRDFVSVHDITQACSLAMTSAGAPGRAFNVGSGCPISVRDLALRIGTVLGSDLKPVASRKYRMGDVRHCFADIKRARTVLGYKPAIKLDDGLVELAEWLDGQVAHDRVAQASAELASRGLTL
jgi:dTDP-L-rhamnose 4-epimerase